MRRWINVAAASDGLQRASLSAVARKQSSRVVAVIAAAAVVGALLGGVLRLAWPELALADDTSCTTQHNTEASDGYHAGMRSSQMTVEDYTVYCTEVDSVGLFGPQSASVEIGVSHDGPSATPCEGAFQSSPYLFIFRETETGAWKCVEPSGQTVTPWDKEGFSVNDQNQDGNWNFAHNGVVFSDPFGTLAWSKGTTWTNSERHALADSAWGHFEQNGYMSVTNGWTDWDNSYYCYRNDNDTWGDTHFFQQLWSPANITVSTGSGVCP